MITGTSLMTFLRQASRISSDKQDCTSLLESEIYDFSQVIYLLFDAFVFQMTSIGIFPPQMASIGKCSSLFDLKSKNRTVIRNLPISKSHLFSKSEYNFGICFLYLYYFQNILDILLPKDVRSRSDENDEEDSSTTFPKRITQEEAVLILTGSKDRTHVHDTVGVVCTDLAAIMNRQLKQESSRFQKIIGKLQKTTGNRSFTVLQGIRGIGKSDFLMYLDRTGKNVRYYPNGNLVDFAEMKSWIVSCFITDGQTSDRETIIILRNFKSFSFSEVYDLIKGLQEYTGKEQIHVIVTSRSNTNETFFQDILTGFHIQVIEVPLLDTIDIMESLNRNHIPLDPKKILEATFGYPPLVNYCSTHRTEKIPESIYFKSLSTLFEIRNIKELVKLRLFLCLAKDGMFDYKQLHVRPLQGNEHLFEWEQFIQKAEENGLLTKSHEPEKWNLNPVVSFLSDKILLGA